MSVPDREDIYRKIGEVLDPELDEPLLDLGFIERVEIDGPAVTVAFRLPTYWCAPNFAFLMASDLRTKVSEVVGVERVQVMLRDHCANDEVTDGVNSGKSFGEAFPDDTVEDLEELRRTFALKAFLVRQEQMIRPLLKAGCDAHALCSLHIGNMWIHGDDVTYAGAGEQVWKVSNGASIAEVYLRKRAALGLNTTLDAPLFTDSEGNPISADELGEYLRRSRAMRLNMALNASLCSGLLKVRYGDASDGGGATTPARLAGPGS